MFDWFFKLIGRKATDPLPSPVNKKAMPTPYTDTYNKAEIRPKYSKELTIVKKRILEERARYEAVAQTLGNGIPWWFIGITHFMEAGLFYPHQFNYHLHCGDPLTARTTHVPKGRPKADPIAGKGKPYTWEESAIDALKYMKYDAVKDWSIENCLILFEKFNGMGYKKRGVPSPYLWSYTTNYLKGKYDGDGHYNSELVSKQAGTAAIMKVLLG